jgi:hypothetical protein
MLPHQWMLDHKRQGIAPPTGAAYRPEDCPPSAHAIPKSLMIFVLNAY